MRRISVGITASLTLLTLLGCGHKETVPPSYYDSVRAWQTHREVGLRKPDSWLTLAGLFWLKPGDNTIGSADSNDLVLAKTNAPAKIGKLTLAGNKVVFTNLAGDAVQVNGKPVVAPVTLSYDEDNPDKVQVGSVSFFIIKRLDRLGVRAKDTASPVLAKFTGTKFFPIDPEFHFHAKLVPSVKKIPILNVLGQTEMQESPGIVEFTYRGELYQLRPIYEGKTLFFLFKDPTNKVDTYQAGRMLNTPLPVDGRVDLDFNRSYNPPCTFTPYATCPLPPKENTISFPVKAGEMRYGTGHADY